MRALLLVQKELVDAKKKLKSQQEYYEHELQETERVHRQRESALQAEIISLKSIIDGELASFKIRQKLIDGRVSHNDPKGSSSDLQKVPCLGLLYICDMWLIL